MRTNHQVFFSLIEVRMPFVIHGFCTSFCCLRLIFCEGACLSTVWTIRSTNRSNTILKFTRVTACVSMFSILSFFSSTLKKTSALKFFFIAVHCHRLFFFFHRIKFANLAHHEIMVCNVCNNDARSNIMSDIIGYDVIYDCC